MSYLDLDFRKAVESLILYRRHLAEELGDSEPGLILVTQDGYLAMRDSIDPRSRHTLERYRKRDINGKVMFYDSVRELGSRQFVKFAKRQMLNWKCLCMVLCVYLILVVALSATI